jgi:site-specific recombinase XerD
VRNEGTQRTHCAALAKFIRICEHLQLDAYNITTFDELVSITTSVLSWASSNGAKVYWVRAIRTALSVLFSYKFSKMLSDNKIVQSVVHLCNIRQLPIRKPLQLTWELPDLLQYVRRMPANGKLSYVQLQRKCIVLILIFSAARFSEIIQFSDASNPEIRNQIWKFVVKVKGKAYRQPIALHRLVDTKLDPVTALMELRRRMNRKRWSRQEKKAGPFWRSEHGVPMTAEDLRRETKQLMNQADIQDSSPYHIKHATLTWLHQHGAASDSIIRFARHAQSSTTYMEYYLEEDLGAACTHLIERTTTAAKEKTKPTTYKAEKKTRTTCTVSGKD